ncbi:kinesin-like protein KIN-7L [Asparagus officinalis]|uniref:kinesin-like protein KIN-7L n=1 Tax=Asparagus officinalis TaxID=4686 RepID=UPI00098E6519|nr:kinesin-like protein KIN-7L [Asparagus officinalis]
MYSIKRRGIRRSVIDSRNPSSRLLLMDSMNCICLWADKQGKTFTVNGSEDDPGIIHCAVKGIFHSTQMNMDREFIIRCPTWRSTMKRNDLLMLRNQKLPIHESLDKAIPRIQSCLVMFLMQMQSVFLFWAHIPYHDSKLTHILQPALVDNAKTSITCKLAPEEVHIKETRGTLQFVSGAKHVTSYAQVNEELAFHEGASKEKSRGFQSEFSMNKSQFNTFKQQYTALESECNLLREEEASLNEALSVS